MYRIEHLHDSVHHQTSRTAFENKDSARVAMAKIFARCYGTYPIVERTFDSFSFRSKNTLHTLRVVEN